jgi:signal transduction histidine kinase
VNAELREHQTRLEEKIAERTRDLAEAQALALHQEKQAAFGLLAAGIAHEVGNPLTSISGLVQMLQRKSGDPQVQEKLALVSGQLDRIQATLRDLVCFSRPASAERSLVSLDEAVREAMAVAKYHKRLGGRTLRTELPDHGAAPIVRASRAQLAQALLNLILNAIDAAPPGSQIVVAVRGRHGEAVIEVRDDGPAVAPEHEARLFQPYFTTKPDGTGLGLFMTRRLIEEHGGTLSYEPFRPGPGKAFRLHLPLAHDSSAARSDPHDPSHRGATHGQSIDAGALLAAR